MILTPEVESDLRKSFYNILNCVAPDVYAGRFASIFAGSQPLKLPWFDNYLPVRGCTLRLCAFEVNNASGQARFAFAFVLEADANMTAHQYAAWSALNYGIHVLEYSRILLPDITHIQLDPESKMFMKRMHISPVLESYPERDDLLQQYEKENARTSVGVGKLNLGGANGCSPSTEDLIIKCMTYKGPDADVLRIAATMVCQLKSQMEIESICSIKLKNFKPLAALYYRLQSTPH